MINVHTALQREQSPAPKPQVSFSRKPRGGVLELVHWLLLGTWTDPLILNPKPEVGTAALTQVGLQCTARGLSRFEI